MFGKFVTKSIEFGFFSGIVVSIVFWIIVFLLPSIFMLYGIVLGAVLGILTGAINGIALGIITFSLNFNVDNTRKYRYVMMFSSVVLTSLFIALVFHDTLRNYSATGNANPTLVLLATALAAVAAAYSSQLLVTWYLNVREIV